KKHPLLKKRPPGKKPLPLKRRRRLRKRQRRKKHPPSRPRRPSPIRRTTARPPRRRSPRRSRPLPRPKSLRRNNENLICRSRKSRVRPGFFVIWTGGLPHSATKRFLPRATVASLARNAMTQMRTTMGFFGLRHLATAAAAVALLSAGAGSAGAADWRSTSSLINADTETEAFTRYSYVNPDAPKGGTLNQTTFGTFDSFNP